MRITRCPRHLAFRKGIKTANQLGCPHLPRATSFYCSGVSLLTKRLSCPLRPHTAHAGHPERCSRGPSPPATALGDPAGRRSAWEAKKARKSKVSQRKRSPKRSVKNVARPMTSSGFAHKTRKPPSGLPQTTAGECDLLVCFWSS